MTVSTGVGRGNHGNGGRKRTGLPVVHFSFSASQKRTAHYRRLLTMRYERQATDKEVRLFVRKNIREFLTKLDGEVSREMIKRLTEK